MWLNNSAKAPGQWDLKFTANGCPTDCDVNCWLAKDLLALHYVSSASFSSSSGAYRYQVEQAYNFSVVAGPAAGAILLILCLCLPFMRCHRFKKIEIVLELLDYKAYSQAEKEVIEKQIATLVVEKGLFTEEDIRNWHATLQYLGKEKPPETTATVSPMTKEVEVAVGPMTNEMEPTDKV